MKKRFFLLLISIVFTLSGKELAQWIQANGYGGSIINVFAFSSNMTKGVNIFVGTDQGIILSSDNGTSWTEINNGLTSTDVRTFVVSGSNLFAGTYGGGVFLSTNNGTNWIAVDTGLTNTYVQAIIVSGSNLFAGTYGGGVFLSTNNGTSWTAVNSGLTNTDVRTFAVSGSNLFAGTWGGGVFLSTNNGTSWEAVSSGTGFYDVSTLAVSDSNLFAGNSELGGIILSTNNSKKWKDISAPSSAVTALTVSPNGNLFAGTTYGGGVFLSTNNGTNWTAVNNGLANRDVNALAVSSNGNLFAGTNHGGVFLSTDNGTNWTNVISNLAGHYISVLTASSNASGGTNLFAGGDGVYFSTNDGASWIENNSGLPFPVNVSTLTINPDGGLFLGTTVGTAGDEYWGDGVFLSTNDGTSWKASNSGLPAPDATTVSALTISPNGNLYLGDSHDGVFLSTDNGADWTEINNGLTNRGIKALAINSIGDLFAGTYGGVFLSTNNGTNWTAVNSGLTDNYANYVNALIVSSNEKLFAGTIGGIFLTTNNGGNWTAVNNGLAEYGVSAFAVNSNGDLFAAAGGVVLSTNDGASWTEEGLTKSIINTVTISGSYLYAGTSDGGVWRRSLSEMITSTGNEQINLPTHYKLYQNYPNPFNPTTIIKYSIPKLSHVIIKVYDLLGREMKTLVNEQKPAGNYKITFNASGLSSGVYFYQLRAGSFTRTKKLVLLR